MLPRPKASVDLRTEINFLVADNSEDRLRDCASTLTACSVNGIHDRRRVESCRVGVGKAAIAVWRPLHRGAHAVAIAEIDVVAHADLVAVIDDRRARERH